uniref:C-type lectin domain-containing protein n=1 Tax=Oryzias latipes TaxID=8090 RepID=A0A3P9J5P1_ORYLA
IQGRHKTFSFLCWLTVIWVCLSLAELRCPGLDWLEFGEFCYKPFGDRKTWQDAQRVCRDLGAELVSIMSMKEQSWVESYFYMATNNLWTGLNDLLVPGMFTWSDDFEVTFTYWAPGEPNNHNGFSEDCVEMLYETGRWNDKSCSELNNYICKKPKAHYPALFHSLGAFLLIFYQIWGHYINVIRMTEVVL